MKRRCSFLDHLDAFNYNEGLGREFGSQKDTDTTNLGSTLMYTMLNEVREFCNPKSKLKSHQQVTIAISMYIVATCCHFNFSS